jgi:hypothetical protein
VKNNYKIGLIHYRSNDAPNQPNILWYIKTLGIFNSDNPFKVEPIILSKDIAPVRIPANSELIKNNKRGYLQYGYMEPIIFNVKNGSENIDIKKIKDLKDLNLLCNIIFNCVLTFFSGLDDKSSIEKLTKYIIIAFRKNNFLNTILN